MTGVAFRFTGVVLMAVGLGLSGMDLAPALLVGIGIILLVWGATE